MIMRASKAATNGGNTTMVEMAAKRELTWLVFMTASSFGSRTQKLVIDKIFFLYFFLNSFCVKTSSCLKLGIAF